MDQKVNLFVSYAHEDLSYLGTLKKHLAPLSAWQERLTIWWDGEIQVGSSWSDAIAQALEQAHIVVFLVTADLMASDFVRCIEVTSAFERHKRAECEILPVRVRDVDLGGTPFEVVQWTPRDSPIVGPGQRDRKWKEVAEAVGNAVNRQEARLLAAGKVHQDIPRPGRARTRGAAHAVAEAPVVPLRKRSQRSESATPITRHLLAELVQGLSQADFTDTQSWAVSSLRLRNLRADLASSAERQDLPAGWANTALGLVDAIDELGSNTAHRSEAARLATIKKGQLIAIERSAW
jgi:hypothetical protein